MFSLVKYEYLFVHFSEYRCNRAYFKFHSILSTDWYSPSDSTLLTLKIVRYLNQSLFVYSHMLYSQVVNFFLLPTLQVHHRKKSL